MRKGSNFSGTEQELQIAMRENLSKFVSDILWLDTIKETVSTQAFIDICESIAECVDYGYLNNTKYIVHANKTIRFLNKTIYVGEPPKDAPKPFSLSESGKQFLGLS